MFRDTGARVREARYDGRPDLKRSKHRSRHAPAAWSATTISSENIRAPMLGIRGRCPFPFLALFHRSWPRSPLRESEVELL